MNVSERTYKMEKKTGNLKKFALKTRFSVVYRM